MNKSKEISFRSSDQKIYCIFSGLSKVTSGYFHRYSTVFDALSSTQTNWMVTGVTVKWDSYLVCRYSTDTHAQYQCFAPHFSIFDSSVGCFRVQSLTLYLTVHITGNMQQGFAASRPQTWHYKRGLTGVNNIYFHCNQNMTVSVSYVFRYVFLLQPYSSYSC